MEQKTLSPAAVAAVSGSSSGSVALAAVGRSQGESGFNSCYLGHSGIIIVTLLTSLSTATLLLLHYYLTNNHPRKYTAVGNSLAGWGGAVLGVWVYSFGIALLPWAGWNSWITHDARCHLSTLWPLSFTTFLTFLVGAHMAATLFMWASSRAAQLKASDARLTTRVNRTPAGVIDSEAVPITHTITQGNTEGRVGLCGWAITVSSTVPLMGHVVVASSCAASALCLSSPHHYHEDAAALPWASLLLTAAAVANPLLYVFSDDQVSSTTLMVLSRMCCCWRKGRQERLVSRQSESRDAETNVYVTNDTDHLVADNT
ncbi:hypothetical protein Avbf_00834 [Armadillidium vulgare]|nr:hypothetical protein Avbf_00834 [Armadillidium vulgare]